MTSTELASLLLKEAQDYLDSSNAYLNDSDRAIERGLVRVASTSTSLARQCTAIATKLIEAA